MTLPLAATAQLPDGLPFPSDPVGFQSLYTKKRGIFIKLSTPYLVGGRIEESDIFSASWLCYQDAVERWDPGRGASLVTHWINLYRIYLYENYGAQTVCVAPDLPHDNDHDSDDTVVDDGYRAKHLSMGASGFSVMDFAGGQDDWFSPSSESSDDLVSSDEFFCMIDFLATHPVWFHARYRSILQSINTAGTVAIAATEMDRSPSRARQIERRLRSILARPNLVRDSRIPLEDPIPDNNESPLRYSPIQKLQAHPLKSSHQRAFNALAKQIHSAQRIVSPIVIDQYGRILDGNLRFHVANHYSMATVPTIIHPVRQSSTSDIYDPDFLLWKSILSGKPINSLDKPANASPDFPLFSL